MPPEASPSLPILERRKEIETALLRHQVVVICGPTGSGKTTQLPQICLDLGLAAKGLIGHTQPRRLAARAVAARIAEERGVSLGSLVGVKVRFLDQTSRATRIKVLTDGMLLAELTSDPRLNSYGIIIIDEAHERSLNVDFLLGYLRRLLPTRPELKVIVTSATIDPGRFSEFFGGSTTAPVIEVSGRAFPVELRYRPGKTDDDEAVNPERVADAVDDLVRPSLPEGDMLVFLPGEQEIRLVDQALRRRAVDAEVLPLYSRLSNQEQDQIFHPGPRRRVILATNVAETSLTVPRITHVVDTGLARINRYDPERKVQRLPVEPVSRASADQRAGRCGRTAPGVCVRLYSEESYASRPRFTDPEIRRTNLASVVLQMRALDLGPVDEFPFLDPPDPRSLEDAFETLFELGAIDAPDARGALTAVGARMARVPVEPRVARMLLAADTEGSLREVLVLAAVLSIQDPRERPMGRQENADRAQEVFRHESSDFLTLLRVWDQFQHAAGGLAYGALVGWCRDHFLSPARMREWGELLDQLAGIAEEIDLRLNERPASEDAIHRALLTGLISSVACREADGGSFDYRSARAGSVQIFPGSVLFRKAPRWIMAAELVHTTRLYARTVARIEPEWIEELAGHMFRRQLSDQHLDPATGEPSAWERVTMSGIVVVPRRRAAIAGVDPKAARALLILDGLVRAKWELAALFMEHNRGVREAAQQAVAKLRRPGVLVADEELAAWFDGRIPGRVCDPASLRAWCAEAEASDPRVLMLPLGELLRPEARVALDPLLFPDSLELGESGSPIVCPIRYALSPGKDDDGVTLTVPLTGLPRLTPERAAWLVSGMLPDLVQGLIKILPKARRSLVEVKAAAADVAAACAAVLCFGEGSLGEGLSEAIEVLYGVSIDPGAWSFKALPAHLRMRIRVVDERSAELGAGRDVTELMARLEGRLRRAHAAQSRGRFQREGVESWDFGRLPERVEVELGGAGAAMYPALVDAGDSASLALVESPREAGAQTLLGVRRLFEVGCRDELEHYVQALPQWGDMVRQFGQLGTPRQLRNSVSALIADRVFTSGQPAVGDGEEFERRLVELRGRLPSATREVGEAVARMLEARFKIAQRLAGGTPRLWADSIADIREHAAYLMPRGFLLLLPWERVRHYPRYVESARERLFTLREGGSRVETRALSDVAPHWKRFTGWVAASMSAARALGAAAGETAGESGAARGKSGDHKRRAAAPLPQARRAAPAVNVDAGEWAMRPGIMPPLIEQYRWMLEELRVGLFGAESDAGGRVSPASSAIVAELDVLWKKHQAPAPGAASRS